MANLLMCWADVISIHAPREGGDIDVSVLDYEQHADFNPRPPRGGRHCSSAAHRRAGIFQSTPPARGATVDLRIAQRILVISIHAPREGGDIVRPHICDRALNFNPRPREGGDQSGCYPTVHRADISIHAPREGGDTKIW